jgi:hypothetical protein
LDPFKIIPVIGDRTVAIGKEKAEKKGNGGSWGSWFFHGSAAAGQLGLAKIHPANPLIVNSEINVLFTS